MAQVCSALGSVTVAALRPSATSSAACRAAAAGRRPAAARTPLSRAIGHHQFSNFSGGPQGFPPMPPLAPMPHAPPGRGYAPPGAAYGEQQPMYGGAPAAMPTGAPPTIEWDPRNTTAVTVIGNTGGAHTVSETLYRCDTAAPLHRCTAVVPVYRCTGAPVHTCRTSSRAAHGAP